MGRRDEQREPVRAEERLEPQPSFHIHIEDRVKPFRFDALHFIAQGAIETPGVHFLPLHEFTRSDAALELLDGEEMIIVPVTLAGPHGPGGGAHAESQSQPAFHQMPHDGGLACARRG